MQAQVDLITLTITFMWSYLKLERSDYDENDALAEMGFGCTHSNRHSIGLHTVYKAIIRSPSQEGCYGVIWVDAGLGTDVR